MTLRGTKTERDRTIAKVVMAWVCLGFGPAFAKGQRGNSITWIGAAYKLSRTDISVTIKKERCAELEDITAKLSKSNITSMKDLKSYAGKAQSFASLIPAWRPFITDLYGVIYSEDKTTSTKAPRNCVWTKQFAHALMWVGAFLQRQRGAITRVYNIDDYFWRGEWVEMTLDASPWGFGATLRANGVYTHGTLMPSRNKVPNASTPSSGNKPDNHLTFSLH